MIDEYRGALRLREEHPTYPIDEAARRFSSSTKWDQGLKRRLARQERIEYSFNNIWPVQYRPFVKQYGYLDSRVSWSKYQMDSIFPAVDSENRAICVPGVGSTKPFSALMADSMPDLELISKGQCFPRYRYRPPANAQRTLPGHEQKLERVDNISDTTLRAFRVRYKDNTITKDEIFDYIYGLLHAPTYRERFANDLSKGLPRIPFAPDFRTFATAGRELARIHLDYETSEEYPLELHCDRTGEPQPEHFRIGAKKMRWVNPDKTELAVNEHIRLQGIPAAAHQYEVNGRTPIEWFIDRYLHQEETSEVVSSTIPTAGLRIRGI